MASHTVYDHIRQNDIITVALVVTLPLIISLLFYGAMFLGLYCIAQTKNLSYGYVLQLFFHETGNMIFYIPVIVFALTTAWTIYCWKYGADMMLSFAGADKPLKPNTPENKEIYRLVQNTALMAGLPMPKIYIIEDEALNAFATGKDPFNASITLTTGIVKKLTKLELQGVIAHEMAHIGNRDIRLNMLIIIVVGFLGFIGTICFRLFDLYVRLPMRRSSRRNKKDPFVFIMMALFILGCVLKLVNIFYAPILQFAISRTREYAADATAAFITRNPGALASALSKISKASHFEYKEMGQSLSVACIAAPITERLFSTHPPIKERIRRLNDMAGLYQNMSEEE